MPKTNLNISRGFQATVDQKAPRFVPILRAGRGKMLTIKMSRCIVVYKYYWTGTRHKFGLATISDTRMNCVF